MADHFNGRSALNSSRPDGSSWRRPQRRRVNLLGRPARLVLLSVAACALLALVAEAVTLGLAVRDLQRGAALLSQAAALIGQSPDGWSAQRIDAAIRSRDQAERLLLPAHARIQHDPILRFAETTPAVGDQVKALLDLDDSAVAASAVVGDLITVARAYGEARNNHGALGPHVLSLLNSSAPPLRDASLRLGHVQTALRRDQQRPLLPQLQSQVRNALDRVEPAAAQAQLGASAAEYAPLVLGADHAKTYLLLFPNPSELRPAGGFVGTVCTLTVKDGTPIELQVRNEADYTPLFKR
ncbi:MAG: DUF4012 domain-containing protein, partial [Candidatus Dormibacteraeota bacterium]|nr:DUF4012 domain-containing protein [Candidatus Dormibacteraeota bacterium]